MNEIISFFSAYIGIIILFEIIKIFVVWFFVRSAVKSGTEAAIASKTFSDTIRLETKEAILDAMIDTGLAEEIKLENLFKS